jgi:hypothetical protein
VAEHTITVDTTVYDFLRKKAVELEMVFATESDVLKVILGLKLAESSKLRVCRECSSVFLPKRTNQVYCPPPSYSRGEESLCATRQRMRSYRNKRSGSVTSVTA